MLPEDFHLLWLHLEFKIFDKHILAKSCINFHLDTSAFFPMYRLIASNFYIIFLISLWDKVGDIFPGL